MINKAQEIYDNLKKIYPTYNTFLNYKKDYEFLFAVMLSAQTTDLVVNNVTKKLFSDLPKLEDYNLDNYNIILEDIKSVGLYKNKAMNLINTAQILINQYQGRVPSSRDKLLLLPGVGIKTSGVVLNQLYKTNYFPVDTHISRISSRLNISKSEDKIEIIEKKLEKYFQGFDLVYLHHAFILFGRNICLSRNPHCQNCPMINLCSYKGKK